MRLTAFASLLLLVGCGQNPAVKQDHCFPGLEEGRVQGLVLHVNAPTHGATTMLLSKTCKRTGLKLELDASDQARADVLSDLQNPAAWQIDGRIAKMDAEGRNVTLKPGAKLTAAQGITGDELYYRFKDGKPLQ